MRRRGRIAESVMYILLALALLPWASFEAHVLAYFLVNPAMLDMRDAALEAPAVLMVVQYTSWLLVPAAMSAIYVLVVASSEGRTRTAILLAASCLSLYLVYLGGQFAFNSWPRLYLESIPTLALFGLVVVFLIRRGFSRRAGAEMAVQKLEDS